MSVLRVHRVRSYMARLGINRTLIFGGATLPAPSIATNGQRPMHTLLAVAPVCTENLNPDVVMMKSAKYGVGFDASGPLNCARDRRIFIQ